MENVHEFSLMVSDSISSLEFHIEQKRTLRRESYGIVWMIHKVARISSEIGLLKIFVSKHSGEQG